MERKILKKMFHSIAIVGTITLSMFSCSDENIVENQEIGDKGVTVSFKVTSSQEEMLRQQQSMSATRAVISNRLQEQGLTLEDLKTRKLEVQGGGIDACLIETTVEGINPVQPTIGTRANIKTSIDANFSSLGYRSDVSGFTPDTPDWFYNAPTQPNGTLVTPRPWAWIKPFARFYAVYPEAKTENKITLSPATYSGTPYVEFEVEKDVKKQKDLMTACSGEVKYETRGVAPETNLKFRHALTAVKFAVGQNLSWNKRIKKVEIKNAYSKGKFILPSELNGTGLNAGWETSSLSTRQDFTLDLSSSPVNTNSNPNTVLTGNGNDNYTFYMIPQQLAGVTVVITLESTHAGSTAPNTISVPLQGSWKPGTTKTYKLSQNTSDWTYVLTTSNPAATAYDQIITSAYGITSYRTAPDGIQEAVKWKVVGYEEYDETTSSWVDLGTTKPAWFTNVSIENGDGGTAAQTGTVTLKKDVSDRLAAYNKVLKENTPKGSSGNYYNLSNPNGGAVIENTANSYLISAPGHYRIPLVYGNAIRNGNNNTSAYISAAPATMKLINGVNQDVILHTFLDHNNQPITSPYINVQNSANPATQASIVWTDRSNLIKFSSLSVIGSGANSFVQFEVTKDDICNGNAVIAVKNSSNVVMWSWHLWFDQNDALNTITCTNKQGKQYAFSKNILGAAILRWKGSNYNKPRQARIKIKQEIGNGGSPKESVINITQNPGDIKKMNITLYQFGRKDALPSTDEIKDGNFVKVSGIQSIGTTIQNPGTMYYASTDHYNSTYYNTWSANNTEIGFNDNVVVKTIYDPSPAGFKIPASNAFTGLTKYGSNTLMQAEFNVDGAFDNGYNFWTNSSKNASIFFPITGFRYNVNGSMNSIDYGYYWLAIPISAYNGTNLVFTQSFVGPVNNISRSSGLPVRPVADN